MSLASSQPITIAPLPYLTKWNWIFIYYSYDVLCRRYVRPQPAPFIVTYALSLIYVCPNPGIPVPYKYIVKLQLHAAWFVSIGWKRQILNCSGHQRQRSNHSIYIYVQIRRVHRNPIFSTTISSSRRVPRNLIFFNHDQFFPTYLYYLGNVAVEGWRTWLLHFPYWYYKYDSQRSATILLAIWREESQIALRLASHNIYHVHPGSPSTFNITFTEPVTYNGTSYVRPQALHSIVCVPANTTTSRKSRFRFVSSLCTRRAARFLPND